MTDAELKKIIIENSVQIEGKTKLACKTAYEIAEDNSVELLDISKICNRDGIRIYKCQLGCF